MKKINIVIPLYNEENNIIKLYDDIILSISKLDYIEWTFTFINDGSNDNSRDILDKLALTDDRVFVIHFLRNYGKEIALTAGLNYFGARIDAVICIDADLQHPPHLITELVKNWEAGFDVVVAVREETENEPFLKRAGSKIFYGFMKKLSNTNLVMGSTDFRLCDKRVISAFLKITERERIFRVIIDWLGFKTCHIYFIAPKRYSGVATYSYGKLINLALRGITSFSLIPLRIVGYLGIAISISSGLLMLVMIFDIFLGRALSFSPISYFIVANTFLMGVVLIAIGLMALYIGTIHTEVIGRPLYLVDEIKNNKILKD